MEEDRFYGVLLLAVILVIGLLAAAYCEKRAREEEGA